MEKREDEIVEAGAKPGPEVGALVGQMQRLSAEDRELFEQILLEKERVSRVEVERAREAVEDWCCRCLTQRAGNPSPIGPGLWTTLRR
jgi:hypothetical protein